MQLREHERRLDDHDGSIRTLHRESGLHERDVALLQNGERELRDDHKRLEEAMEKMAGGINDQFTALRRLAWTSILTFLAFTLALIGNLALELIVRGP